MSNRGCAPPMQCVIDFTALAATPAGYCAFSTPIDGGPFCVATPVTDVHAIAHDLGFSDATAFHRAFRRWTGTTPGEYRVSRGR